MIETMPLGILRRADIGGVKPKFRMRVAEYVVMTPLEMDVWEVVRAEPSHYNWDILPG